MQASQVRFLFLNAGHFLDHFFLLIFATAAALRLTTEWEMSYAELVPYATPGFIAFGVCAVPAGWLADRWSREGMLVIFFTGIGASSVLAGLADNPWQIAVCITLVGIFAAIYHPVGLALVVQGRTRTGVALAINGVFGNMGVASAALATGFLLDTLGWRAAFVIPGVISMFLGALYLWFIRTKRRAEAATHDTVVAGTRAEPTPAPARALFRVFAVIFFTTAVGGLIFQSTTFALPKVFDERLTDLADTATTVGWYAFLVFSVAALAQLLVGYLIDRYPARRVFAGVAALQAVFLAGMVHASGILALLVAVAFMLAVFGQIPINDVLVGRMARSEWRSRAYALRYIVTFSVMASAVPLIAWVHGTWGFATLFTLLAAAASSILIAVLFLPNLERAVQRPSTT